jgi:hypothetical protein
MAASEEDILRSELSWSMVVGGAVALIFAAILYLLVSGFPVYRPGRVDQESKIEAMRRYGGDLQNILRKRSQVFG